MKRPPGPNFASVVEETTLTDKSALYAAIPIETKKWVPVIKEDAREPLAPLRRAKYLVGLLSLLAIDLIIVGSVLTTNISLRRLIKSDREKARSDEVMLHESRLAALSKMAAGVAHEINNPLAVIIEEADWMKDLLKEEDVAHSPNFQEDQETIEKIECHVERVPPLPLPCR